MASRGPAVDGRLFAGVPRAPVKTTMTDFSDRGVGTTDSRYSRERLAHNQIFGEGLRHHLEKYYRVPHASWLQYRNTLVKCGAGKQVLEYGCGTGSQSAYLERNGAERVVGIDLSDVAIAKARAAATTAKLTRTDYFVMNAEQLDYPDNSFDLICGTAILHHLDLDRAFREVTRVLRPTGTAVFLEPLGHNPLINLYRWATPRLRTVDEHPLLMRDLDLARRYFTSVKTDFFVLQSLLAMAFHGSWFEPARDMLEFADAVLFKRLPYVRRYAWQVVLVLRGPVHHGGSP
jgi:ubiquinone/menaquinone biosynthesis C-methylase UbiE